MKKLILTIMLIGVLFVYAGCSAMDKHSEPISLYDNLTFDFNHMTYTETSPADLLFRVGDPFADFVMLYQKELQTTFTPGELVIYQRLFSIIESSLDTHMLFSSVLSLSSSEFTERLKEKDITYTLDDIVSFNNLKTILEQIKNLNTSSTYVISKITYIENRLAIQLSQSDLDDLEVLQDYYQELFDPYSSWYQHYESFDDIIEGLQEKDIYFSEDERLAMQRAYTLITPLINP